MRAMGVAVTSEETSAPRLFEGHLATACELVDSNGRRIFGDLDVSRVSIAERLAGIFEKRLDAEGPEAAAAFAQNLHAVDLYLAIGCAVGSEEAWKIFSGQFRKYLDTLCVWVHGAATGRDLAADIFSDLYLPDASGISRIATYDGRSALATWLRVIVGNRSINEHQRKSNSNLRLSALREVIDRNAQSEIETAIVVRRYRGVLQRAIEQACAEVLTDRERLILLSRYEQNLRLGEIAGLLGIHQSTVTRQMWRAMERFRDYVYTAVRSEGLGIAAAEECVNTIAEADSSSLSILALLRNCAGGGNPARDVKADLAALSAANRAVPPVCK